MCEGKRVFGTIFPTRISIWIGFCCLFVLYDTVTQTIAIIAEVTVQVKIKAARYRTAFLNKLLLIRINTKNSSS